MVESGSLERVALDIQRLSLLKDLRTKFAIAKPGANFHLRPDCRDCADDFAALVRSDRCKRDRYATTALRLSAPAAAPFRYRSFFGTSTAGNADHYQQWRNCHRRTGRLHCQVESKKTECRPASIHGKSLPTISAKPVGVGALISAIDSNGRTILGSLTHIAATESVLFRTRRKS